MSIISTANINSSSTYCKLAELSLNLDMSGMVSPCNLTNYWLQEAVDIFDINSHGYPDSVKLSYKNYMNGIINEFENREPDLFRQKQFKIYLTELDRRRGTDYKKTFPTIAEWLDKV